jgi:hypothetical protein
MQAQKEDDWMLYRKQKPYDNSPQTRWTQTSAMPISRKMVVGLKARLNPNA